MDELNKYYQVLGLSPGASLEEVNQAYKDLAFIWHPDRIPTDNPRLQQKAQDKLKEINHARDQLRLIGKNPPTPKAQPGSSSQPTPSYYKQPPTPSYYKQPPTPSYYKQPPTASQSQSQSQNRKPASDLSGTNLSGADLKEKDFSGRNLSDANLSHANLSDAFLHKVNLQGANLYKANLFRANLLQANLSNACLREANLIGADLSGADLRGADLTGAKIGFNDKIMVKLTGAILAGAIFPDGTIHPG